ncbi:type II secretion system protein M [Candidatus Berkiella cookevillensis]|uniref:General secretion pathway, M protein n=1 Tax=Candidatus Berkiella cookevillensis TaxID=437022 RepID=A0A0Q9YE60_9GAMM|nr:type II secretion system protein GspM [Candidatus Berkiella cookevillensis]MCS5709658.1 type II secretion system protein M [Candidatus Berkiella cookevillensis]
MNHQTVLKKIEQLNKREKILLLITGMVAVLLLSFSFVIEPLSKEKALSHQLLANALSEQALLLKQLKKISKSEKNTSQDNLISEEINAVAKDRKNALLLDKLLQTPGLELISLESIMPKSAKEEVPSPLESYQIHLMGEYPVMLKYITELQALPFFMRFDDFKYKIKKFPQADIYVTVSRYHIATVSDRSQEEKP